MQVNQITTGYDMLYQNMGRKFNQEMPDTQGNTKSSTVAQQEALLKDRTEKLLEKIKNNDTETSYQIGGASFTEKEWQKFLDKFDLQEEKIRESIQEEQERQEAERVREEQREEEVVSEDMVDILMQESTCCKYPSQNPKEDDILYITWYTEEGIFCRKAGQSEGYQWVIPFDTREQYDKVINFIRKFPSDWNMGFAANDVFWKDFLKDAVTVDELMEYMQETDKEVPSQEKYEA